MQFKNHKNTKINMYFYLNHIKLDKMTQSIQNYRFSYNIRLLCHFFPKSPKSHAFFRNFLYILIKNACLLYYFLYF
nr:MAG TPA: hypothetical protein [Caudoviricetes sp.]